MTRYKIAFEIRELHSVHEHLDAYINKPMVYMKEPVLTAERAKEIANKMTSRLHDGYRVEMEVEARSPIEASEMLNGYIQYITTRA